MVAQIVAGSVVARRELRAVGGGAIWLPDGEQVTHLQFRRFAGCPVCNLHLRSIVRRHQEIVAAGIREVVVFHSPAGELLPHVAELPFPVVADPDRRLYREFGVESRARALADPRAWGAIVRGVLRDLGPVLRGRRPAPAARPHGGRLGLPADLLIAADGRVLAAGYGVHADDQWSVDDLLSRHRAAAGDRPGGGSRSPAGPAVR
jgi:AhpC/TSA antioxidant enzyme